MLDRATTLSHPFAKKKVVLLYRTNTDILNWIQVGNNNIYKYVAAYEQLYTYALLITCLHSGSIGNLRNIRVPILLFTLWFVSARL